MDIETGTILSDVPDGFDHGADDDDGVNAFLSHLTGEDPKKRPSTETTDEATDRSEDATSAAAQENNTDEQSGDQQTDAKTEDPDDTEVEVKVGDETKKVPVRDLKRLYGQEAALTQKSQKVAEAQRAAEAVTERASATLKVALSGAEQRFAQYKDLDWLVLSQRMDTETFQALRQDAEQARAELVTLQGELDKHVQGQREAALETQRQAASECVKVLKDPEKGIPDFDRPLYEDMMNYAGTIGVPEAGQITNPNALKVLWKAMLFDREQAAKEAAKGKVEKAVNTAKRVLKPTTTTAETTSASRSRQEAMRALRQSGSTDDAADAFFASMQPA